MCDGSPLLRRSKHVACLLTGMLLAGCSDAGMSATSDRGEANASPAAASGDVSPDQSEQQQEMEKNVPAPANPAPLKPADGRDAAGEAQRPLLKAQAMTGASLSLAIAEDVRDPGSHTVEELVELIQHEDAWIQRAARERLMKLGPNAAAAIPTLIAGLEHEPSFTYWMDQRSGNCVPWTQADDCSAKILARIGAAAVPALIEALGAEHPNVRGGALYALGQMGPPAEAAVPHILSAIAAEPRRPNSDGRTRTIAVWALGQIGPAAREALPVLLESLNASGDDRDAAEAIRKIDPESRQAATLLAKHLESPDERVRRNAVAALSALGPVALPELSRAAENDDPQVREAARQALRKMSE